MLNRIIRILGTAAYCALLLAGCSIQLDDPVLNREPDTGEAIGFSAGSSLLLDDAKPTKAAYYDDTSFGVVAFKQSGGTWAHLASKKWKPNFMFNQEVHCLSSVYTYSPVRYWPNPSQNKITFWAYSPYDASPALLASGSTSTAYTSNSQGLPDMRWTVDGQTDILYSGVVADQTSASNSGVVEFAFNHALSRVDIKAEKVDAGGLYEVTLKEVSFKGMTKKPVYLIGGTGTALAMVFLDKPQFDYKAIEGLEMSISDLEAVTTRISNLSKELRAMLPGLENGRSDVIICGLFWLKSLLEKLRVERFFISTAGLRFGLLYPPEPEPEAKPKAKKTPPWLKKKAEENSAEESAEEA